MAAAARAAATLGGEGQDHPGPLRERRVTRDARDDLGGLAGDLLLALAVTIATEFLDHAATTFRAWRLRMAELLEQGGLTHHDAARFSALLISASEGAVVLSQAERSLEPLELVTEQLVAQVRGLLAAG
ncbi:hypothetical protein [Pseudonocardia sp. GCM10023141]|uniref:LmrA/YxaF family transcription factor n=1 Tax=Pseudonocardia sp. GCM10023141 TaxID=3252653 RepID=UPI0036061A67